MLTAFAFLLGFQATLSQVVLLREFLVGALGSELTFGVCLAVWLTGIGAGAGAGGFLGKRAATRFLRLGLVLLAVAPPVFVFLSRTARVWYPTPGGQIPSTPVLAAFGLFCIAPTAFAAGLVFPCLSEEWRRRRTPSGVRAIGGVYVLEAVGSLTGGILFTYALAYWYRPFAFLTVSGGLLVLLLALDMVSDCRLGALGAGLTVGLGMGTVLFGGEEALEHLSIRQRVQAIAPGLKIEAATDSIFQNILVLSRQEQCTVYGSGRPLFSFPDPYESKSLADLVLTQHPSPRRVLVVGGQDPDLVSAFLAHSVEEMVCLEQDEKVIETALPFFARDRREVLSDPRVRLIFQDPYWFLLDETSRKFDVIYLHQPDPTTALLNRYYTEEFFFRTRAALNRQGMLCFQASATPTLGGGEVLPYLSLLFRTARSVYPHVLVSPGTVATFFCALEEEVITPDPEILASRYRERNLEPPEAAFRYEDEFFPREWTEERNRLLASKLEGERNTLSHPRAYFYASVLWSRFTGSPLPGWLRSLDLNRFLALAVALGILWLGLSAWRPGSLRGPGRSRWISTLSIATTGGVALGTEVLLLIEYQGRYGNVYRQIGLIVALFMIGLAVGGRVSTLWMARAEKKPEIARRALAYVDQAVAAGVAAFYLLARINGLPEWVFALYLVFLGFLTGSQMPIAVAYYGVMEGNTARAASTLDLADHLGAALGGLLTGAVLVPLLGISVLAFFVVIKLVFLPGSYLLILLSPTPPESSPRSPDTSPLP